MVENQGIMPMVVTPMETSMTRWSVALVSLALLGLVSVSEAIAASVQLASHHAVYSMKLGTTRAGSTTVDAQGAMYLEWAESCDGSTVSQRVRLTLYDTQGGEVDTDSNFSSWESKDGLKYRFTVRNLRNGKVAEEYRGDARLDGPGHSGSATFSAPSGVTFNLPKGALFPTEHMVQLLAAAQNGVTRLSRIIFDGANLDGPLEVNAIIGGPLHPVSGGAANGGGISGGAAGDGHNLTNRSSWPVRMAFFPTKSQQAEPEYEVEVRLFDNGVANHFLLDYGDFTVHATLEKIEALPKPKC